jgi:hypothetical protein
MGPIRATVTATALACGCVVGGCGVELTGTARPDGGAAGAHPTSTDGGGDDGGGGGGDAGGPGGGGDAGDDATSGGDAGMDAGCKGVMCGAQCVSDCNGCSAGEYDCGGTCMSSCSACNGGTDYVACLVCPYANRNRMTKRCSGTGPSGCLSGVYAHCPCLVDSDCLSGNNRCSDFLCTACAEPLFNHEDCSAGGTCCTSGASIGKCSC